MDDDQRTGSNYLQGDVSMIREISAIRLIEVACCKEDALALVWEIKNIEKIEVKADKVQVNKLNEKKGTYKVRVHFAGIPWHNEFTYDLYEQGFHSYETHPPASGQRIKRGFVIIPTAENSWTIIHYEQYILPTRGIPL